MEVGIIYSSKDPHQLEIRNLIKNYIAERGMLVKYHESDQPVKSPKIIINGHELLDRRLNRRAAKNGFFPDFKAIANQLDYFSWCL